MKTKLLLFVVATGLLLVWAAKADPVMNSHTVVTCLDTIRDRYFPIGSNFDLCAAETTSTGKIECLRRNSRQVPNISQCSSVPQGNPATANVDGVSIDLPNVMSAQEACGAIADPNTRKACEQDTYGRAFPSTEVNICRTLADNNQILKCLMAIQGACFDDRAANSVCASITYTGESAPPPQVVYQPAPPPPQTVVYQPTPVIVTRPVYYYDPVYYGYGPRPVYIHPVPLPVPIWHRPYHWRHL